MAIIKKLPNGLNLLFEENHASAVISFHMLVKVGSAQEKKHEAGICHVIEHMLFKGTKTRKVGEIAKDVETAGGEINAYTSFDQTVFYINMASRFAKDGLDILADAIQNPTFDPVELEKEKEVILEEIRRDLDNPSRITSETLFEKAYRRLTYKNSIIGNPKTVKSFTQKQILNFYRRWYVPKNMTLVVVGAFNTKKMLKDIGGAFKHFRGGTPKFTGPTTEQMSKGMQFHVKPNPIKSVYFAIGFNIPGINHEDVPALDVLSHILAGADSSRLEQIVKEEKQLVLSVYSYAFTPKHSGLFLIGGLTSSDKANDALVAICDEVRNLHTIPIKDNELARAILNIRSSEIYEKETTTGQAGKYAYFIATAGSHSFEQKYYKLLRNVGVDSVKAVAQKYLTAKNATFVVVYPKGDKQKIDTEKIRKRIDEVRVSKSRPAKVLKVAPPVLHKLKSGIRLITRENHTLPIVTCCAVVPGGLRFENAKNNGINTLISQTMTKGTGNKNAMQIAEAIESIAGEIDAFSGRNSLGLKSEFLSDKFDEGFSLFAEVLTSPTFMASEVAKEKRLIIEAIKNQEDALSTLAFMRFAEAAFPNHPYGLRMLGKRESVSALNQEKLIAYYKKLMRPEQMVIAISGDISPDEAIRLANEKIIFQSKPTGKFTQPSPQTPNKKSITVEYIRKEKEQAHIVVGFLGPTIHSKDRYSLSVLNNILAGQGGRLFLNLRDRMSLAYAVSSTFFMGPEPGFIAVYIGTEPSKIKTAIGGIKKELELLVKKGVTAEELRRSKNNIVGTYEMDHQRNSAIANAYAFNELYGLGVREVENYPNKIVKVTAADIQRTAKKYLLIDAPVISIVKPA